MKLVRIFILKVCGATLFWCRIFKTVRYDPTFFICPINQWHVFLQNVRKSYNLGSPFCPKTCEKSIPVFSFCGSEKFFFLQEQEEGEGPLPFPLPSAIPFPLPFPLREPGQEEEEAKGPEPEPQRRRRQQTEGERRCGEGSRRGPFRRREKEGERPSLSFRLGRVYVYQ